MTSLALLWSTLPTGGRADFTGSTQKCSLVRETDGLGEGGWGFLASS